MKTKRLNFNVRGLCRFGIYGFALTALTTLALGCKKEKNPPVPSEPELITTVRLVFSEPQGLPFHFDYKVIDGQMSADTVRLKQNQEYKLEVHFLNEYGQTPEDVTDEILEESRTHLVLMQSEPKEAIEWLSGNLDEQGEPLHQERNLKTGSAGTGSLKIWLMHQPTNKWGQEPSSAGGETDAEAPFPLQILP